MPQTLVIHGSLPKLNETIRATKSHWSRYAAEKRKHTEAVAWAALEAKLRPVTAPVEITFAWFSANRRADPDNIRYAAKHMVKVLKEKGEEIEIARENEINELRAYTDCLEGKMSGVTGTVRGRQLIAMINNCKEMHPSLE